MKSCTTSFVLRVLISTSIVLAVSGCASSKIPPMTEQMIKSHKGDVDGLWDIWILPSMVQHKGRKGIPFGADEVGPLKTTMDSVSNDFGRYCADNEGILTTIYCRPYNSRAECVFSDGRKAPTPSQFSPNKPAIVNETQIDTCNAKGGLIGTVSLEKQPFLLVPSFDSPKLRKQQEDESRRISEEAYRALVAGLASDTLDGKAINALMNKLENFYDRDNVFPKAREKMKVFADESRERTQARSEAILAQSGYTEPSKSNGACPSIRQDQIQRMERFISDFESTCRATSGRVVHGDLQFQCNLPHGTSYAIFFRRNESCKYYAVNKSNVTGEKIIQETVGYFD